MKELRFEDLSEGQRFASGPVIMTEADIVAFASDFDPQPMHLDKASAEAGPLGGLIASGWHTAAVAMTLQRQIGLPGTGLAEIASLAWPLPVRPGDELHAEIEIKTLEAPDRVQFQNTVMTAAGATVLVMNGTVLVPRRSDKPERI